MVLCLNRLYVDEPTSVAAFGEDNCAVDKSIDRVVFAHANVQARMVNGATLTFDDVAGLGKLTTENLDSESFAF